MEYKTESPQHGQLLSTELSLEDTSQTGKLIKLLSELKLERNLSHERLLAMLVKFVGDDAIWHCEKTIIGFWTTEGLVIIPLEDQEDPLNYTSAYTILANKGDLLLNILKATQAYLPSINFEAFQDYLKVELYVSLDRDDTEKLAQLIKIGSIDPDQEVEPKELEARGHRLIHFAVVMNKPNIIHFLITTMKISIERPVIRKDEEETAKAKDEKRVVFFEEEVAHRHFSVGKSHTTDLGKTPTELAIKHGNLSLVEMLLMWGADAKRKNPETLDGLLHLAAAKGSRELCATLIYKYGLSTRERNNKGELPIHIALKEQQLAVADYFISIDPLCVCENNKDRDTALKIIFQLGNLALIRKLIQFFYSDSPPQLQTARESSDHTPQTVSVAYLKREEILEALSRPPFLLADLILGKKFKAVKFLLKFMRLKTNLFRTDKNRYFNRMLTTCFYAAACVGSISMVAFLIKLGVNINETTHDADSNTNLEHPLIYIERTRNYFLAHCLITWRLQQTKVMLGSRVLDIKDICRTNDIGVDSKELFTQIDDLDLSLLLIVFDPNNGEQEIGYAYNLNLTNDRGLTPLFHAIKKYIDIYNLNGYEENSRNLLSLITFMLQTSPDIIEFENEYNFNCLAFVLFKLHKLKQHDCNINPKYVEALIDILIKHGADTEWLWINAGYNLVQFSFYLGLPAWGNFFMERGVTPTSNLCEDSLTIVSADQLASLRYLREERPSLFSHQRGAKQMSPLRYASYDTPQERYFPKTFFKKDYSTSVYLLAYDALVKDADIALLAIMLWLVDHINDTKNTREETTTAAMRILKFQQTKHQMTLFQLPENFDLSNTLQYQHQLRVMRNLMVHAYIKEALHTGNSFILLILFEKTLCSMNTITKNGQRLANALVESEYVELQRFRWPPQAHEKEEGQEETKSAPSP